MRRALVTGGSGAIGAAICHALASAGHYVIVHGHHNRNAAVSIADSIVAAGGRAEPVVFDVADADSVVAALGTLVTSEPIQILVNNAGFADDAPLAGMTP